MDRTITVPLPDELSSFVDENCGNGKPYASPGEFVRDLLRQRKLQGETAGALDAIIEGYHDAIAGRTVAFRGNLRPLLRKVDK